MDDVPRPPPPSSAPTSTSTSNGPLPWKRWVRRVHLYLGLALAPWVLLFGLSGMLFNHPTSFETIHRTRLGPETLEPLTGLRPMSPDALAQEVVSQLHNDGLILVDGTAHFHGWPMFVAQDGDAVHTAFLDLEGGALLIGTRPYAKEVPHAPFSGRSVVIDGASMADWETALRPALAAAGRTSGGPLRAHPKARPQLRFVVEDRSKTSFQVTYDLARQTLDGRPEDLPTARSLNGVLDKLHTTHHYTLQANAHFFWALFADITGIALVLWVLSGWLMWWQLKALRRVGLVVTLVSLLGFGALASGVLAEHDFGHYKAARGPGRPKAPAAKAKPEVLPTPPPKVLP